MATQQQMKRQQEFLIQQEYFRKNAVFVIEKMLEMCKEKRTEPSSLGDTLMDELLHSIFFLGKINNPDFSPEQILDKDDDMLNVLRGRYPQSFQHYSSQVPKRSPMSCALDMIVHLKKQENEDEIIKTLNAFTLTLNPGKTKHLVSSTICVSQKTNSQRYYGVSMSTSGPVPGRIMIAASCLSTWDSYVAGAVMTYYPKKVKKEYFDGTIKIPEQVRCQAFSLTKIQDTDTNTKMPPCGSCKKLFGLTTSDENEWAFGHCAEAESLSNFLKNENEVKHQLTKTWTDENRQKATESVLKELTNLLKMQKFTWDKHFYTPQV